MTSHIIFTLTFVFVTTLVFFIAVLLVQSFNSPRSALVLLPSPMALTPQHGPIIELNNKVDLVEPLPISAIPHFSQLEDPEPSDLEAGIILDINRTLESVLDFSDEFGMFGNGLLCFEINWAVLYLGVDGYTQKFVRIRLRDAWNVQRAGRRIARKAKFARLIWYGLIKKDFCVEIREVGC